MRTDQAMAILQDHWMGKARQYVISDDPEIAASGRAMLGMLPAYFAWIEHERTEHTGEVKSDVIGLGAVIGLMLAIMGGIAVDRAEYDAAPLEVWFEKMAKFIHQNSRMAYNKCADARAAAEVKQ